MVYSSLPFTSMDDNSLLVSSPQQDIFQPLLIASNSSTPEKALEILIEASRTSDGRSDLTSKDIFPVILNLCETLSSPSSGRLLFMSLKLLRNLCAGELTNQDFFVEHDGVGFIFSSLDAVPDSDFGIIRLCLQVLANVSLAGKEHRLAIWSRFFPLKFIEIASLRRRETCDPLCMVIYTCSDGSNELLTELCAEQGLSILEEIIRTASTAGFGEDWFKLLLSKICLDENQFPQLCSRLCLDGSGTSANCEDVFTLEQAYLLNILSEILNERIEEISISSDFASSVLGILKQVVGTASFLSREKSGIPTGLPAIDVLGYSLAILREICAHDSSGGPMEDGIVDIVDLLLSSGLVELLLSLLRNLEPPAIIRKTMKQNEDQEGTTSNSSKPCPYKGFRRDIVAVIGNCAYHRKRVQDEIRERNGLVLLLQQCVPDEDNPFLREWAIWSVRNLLEGNPENQQAVSELELQESVDAPEIAALGLKVEVDQKSRRAKLVNVS